MDGIYLEPVKCDFQPDANGNPIQTNYTACSNGYIDLDTGACVASCGVGRYGVAKFTRQMFIRQSYCAVCHYSCWECAGPNPNDCLSCNTGRYLHVGHMSLYLNTNSRTRSNGVCIVKTNFHYT